MEMYTQMEVDAMVGRALREARSESGSSSSARSSRCSSRRSSIASVASSITSMVSVGSKKSSIALSSEDDSLSSVLFIHEKSAPGGSKSESKEHGKHVPRKVPTEKSPFQIGKVPTEKNPVQIGKVPTHIENTVQIEKVPTFSENSGATERVHVGKGAPERVHVGKGATERGLIGKGAPERVHVGKSATEKVPTKSQESKHVGIIETETEFVSGMPHPENGVYALNTIPVVSNNSILGGVSQSRPTKANTSTRRSSLYPG